MTTLPDAFSSLLKESVLDDDAASKDNSRMDKIKRETLYLDFQVCGNLAIAARKHDVPYATARTACLREKWLSDIGANFDCIAIRWNNEGRPNWRLAEIHSSFPGRLFVDFERVGVITMQQLHDYLLANESFGYKGSRLEVIDALRRSLIRCE